LNGPFRRATAVGRCQCAGASKNKKITENRNDRLFLVLII
jgi:hypothetical protein